MQATTAAIALIAAIVGILTSRKIARDKATLDLIEKRESTDHYRRINRTFSELRKGPGFGHLAGELTPVDAATDAENQSDRQDVIDYLNHYEMVAIGIERRLLDAATYRAWMQSAFVRDWNAAANWVQRERWRLVDGAWKYHPSILAAYQRIACRWSKDAIRLTEDWGEKPAGSPPNDNAA